MMMVVVLVVGGVHGQPATELSNLHKSEQCNAVCLCLLYQ